MQVIKVLESSNLENSELLNGKSFTGLPLGDDEAMQGVAMLSEDYKFDNLFAARRDDKKHRYIRTTRRRNVCS